MSRQTGNKSGNEKTLEELAELQFPLAGFSKRRNFINLSKVFQQISNTLMITDKDRRVVWVNKSFRQRSGYKLSEIKGKKPQEFLFEEATCEPDKKEGPLVLLCKTKKGEQYWLEVRINPILDNQGNVVGYTAVGSDITAQHLQNEEIKNQSRLLNEINWLNSHEMRKPVASILGLIDLINNCQEDQIKEKEEYIKLLNDCVKDMDNIIHEVNEKIFFATKKLTKRELDVLEGIKQGLSNNEIGQKLFISPKTVNQHLKSIYKKMEVESRAKLLAKLFSRKIMR